MEKEPYIIRQEKREVFCFIERRWLVFAKHRLPVAKTLPLDYEGPYPPSIWWECEGYADES